MRVPTTRFAQSGEVNIAYQVVGEGEFDVVFIPGAISHVDLIWDDPSKARFFERLSSFGRLIVFDKRGTGASDPAEVGDLETRIDDVRAVMDAAGSRRAALVGVSEARADESAVRGYPSWPCRCVGCVRVASSVYVGA